MGWLYAISDVLIQHKLNSTMKFLKFSFVMLMMLGLTTIWSCGDDTVPADPDLAGTWVLVSATAGGTAVTGATMTANLAVTDGDGNGTFTLTNVNNVVEFNGAASGTYTLSGATSITFTSGTETNTATISASPLTGATNWVVSFNANLDQHGDKNNTAYVYTFELQ